MLALISVVMVEVLSLILLLVVSSSVNYVGFGNERWSPLLLIMLVLALRERER